MCGRPRRRLAAAALLVLGAVLPGTAPRSSPEAGGATPPGNRLPTVPGDASDLLLPPLEGNPRLTSSFGEYRGGHYHGGLDYSTGGVIGLPVRAPADGLVVRVRCSGVGYGRALYLRLNDGRTVVFAHLSRFREDIEEAVVAMQDRTGSYEVDFQPQGTLRPVARGEVVAFTGESGAGPPHLHAEVRLGGDVARNPLAHGWDVADAVPPTLTRIRLAPALAGGRVNGGAGGVTLSLDAPEPLVVEGPFRLWAESLDRALPGGNVLATYRLRAVVDAETLATATLDGFDWNHPAEVEWTFDEAAARSADERWVRLDPPPRSRQAIHRAAEAGPGIGAKLAPGDHALILEAEDHAGNRVRRRVPLRVTAPGEDPRLPPAPPGPRLATHGTFLEWRTPGAGGGMVSLTPDGRPGGGGWLRRDLAGGASWRLGRPIPASGGTWTLRFTGAGGGTAEAEAVFLPAGEATRFEIAGLRGEAGPETLYEDLWMLVEVSPETADPGTGAPELRGVGPVYGLAPWAHPLREAMTVTLPLPAGEDVRGVGVYSARGGRWSYEGGEAVAGGIRCRIGNLEDLALLRDLVPPSIAIVRPDPVAPADPLPRIVAVIGEGGSGIARPFPAMTVDGVAVVAEWDPEARELRSHLRRPLAPGIHTVEVTATDRAGNTSAASATLEVR